MLEALRRARGTIDSLVGQIEQMRGMFDDDDGAIAEAVDDADETGRYLADLSLLLESGFVVGKRDPRLNTDFPGTLMVVEPHEESELPTRDGANGPWCIVGNDLAALIAEAANFVREVRT